jgi:DNA-binding transcriptional MocR family regulator
VSAARQDHPPFLTKSEYAYAELRRRILDGQLPPGARLLLRPLASELGVSVMPIRDAIRLLERLGDATREDGGDVLHFDIALPDTGGAGPTLRGLLRAAATGLLAPTGAFLRRNFPEHEH